MRLEIVPVQNWFDKKLSLVMLGIVFSVILWLSGFCGIWMMVGGLRLLVAVVYLFGITGWLIWKNRNETIFMQSHRLAVEIVSRAYAWTRSLLMNGVSHRWSATGISCN